MGRHHKSGRCVEGRKPRSTHVGDESRAAAVAQRWTDSPTHFTEHSSSAHLHAPASDRGVTKRGARKNTRGTGRREGGYQGEEPMPDAVYRSDLPYSMMMRNVLCAFHPLSLHVLKTSTGAWVTISRGRLTYKTGKACWFPLIQSWFPTERASSISSITGGCHVMKPAVQLS